MSSRVVLTLAVICFCCFCSWHSQVRAAVAVLPTKLSELNGFDGIKVKKGIRCKDCCSLVFPKNYGANASEGYQRNLLQTIAFGKKRIQADMNCLQKIEVDALDHLFYLANTKGNLWAGRTLLFGSGPAIDGALAEEYEGMYVLPLLENFNNLEVLLNIGLTVNLADRVCAWAHMHEQVDRIKQLAGRLRAKGCDEFVKRLRDC